MYKKITTKVYGTKQRISCSRPKSLNPDMYRFRKLRNLKAKLFSFLQVLYLLYQNIFQDTQTRPRHDTKQCTALRNVNCYPSFPGLMQGFIIFLPAACTKSFSDLQMVIRSLTRTDRCDIVTGFSLSKLINTTKKNHTSRVLCHQLYVLLNG